MSLSAPEPAPVPNTHEPVWRLVISDMQERDAAGRKKYGTPLQPFNGRDALVDAYQEALDLVVYLRQEMEERVKLAELADIIIELDSRLFHPRIEPEVAVPADRWAQMAYLARKALGGLR